MSVLKLDNLSKYYTSSAGVVMGLSGISLSFELGEFVAITGESGSGKSTLAHVLAGILPYESGELYISGEATSHYNERDFEIYRRDLVSFISQSYGILLGNTVYENVENSLLLAGLTKEEAKPKIHKILEEVELSEFKNRRASKLSSGQKQRLSIARALAKPSKILIADEPTGNLDKENSDKIIKLLSRAAENHLVILITHEFSEAEPYATRKITLADGVVVTDITLGERNSVEELSEKKDTSGGKKKREHLAPYIAWLTAKSRPIFTSIVALFLVFTTLTTFIFLGSFVMALDDTATKNYVSDAFFNGDPTRLVAMKDDSSIFSEKDFEAIAKIHYVTSVERNSYFNDFNYYYRENVDYEIRTVSVNGPNYHPFLNPDDIQVTNTVDFYENGIFAKTVPIRKKSILKSGLLPNGIYEVVSADKNYKIGDTVTVFFRDRGSWSVSAYICAEFTVVGETDFGDGLYFSNEFASVISSTTEDALKQESASTLYSLPVSPKTALIKSYISDSGKIVHLQEPKLLSEIEDLTLKDDEFISAIVGNTIKHTLGSRYGTSEEDKITCRAYYVASFPRLIFTNENLFKKIFKYEEKDQISVYIKDYAYSDRVISALIDNGCFAISPFRIGSATTDPSRAVERYMILGISFGALVLLFILQYFLLKALFSATLNYHFKLMSDIGLRAKTAYLSLALIIGAIAIFAELFGGLLILIMNAAGVEKITAICKYFDTGAIISLFLAHFGGAAITAFGIIANLKRAVFPASVTKSDTELIGMDEV